jgi:hypothetical protein
MRLAKFVNEARVALVTALSFLLAAGCVVIRPASSSRSAFEGAVYKGETVTVRAGSSGNEAFRVFHQGATALVSIQSVRNETEQRAKEFCDRKGKTFETLTETTAVPPYVLNNLPRVEIVFDCVEKPALAASPTSEDPKAASATSEDPKYTKLVNLKKLLDSGVLTQEEFNREKSKILNQP